MKPEETRTPKALLAGFFIILGLGLGAFLSAIAEGLEDHGPGAEAPGIVQELPFLDPPDPSIESATLTPSLVQWGTDSPYTGTGPPGIRLGVETSGDVLEWTLVAWANETTPPPATLCSQTGVHYNEHDWVFRSARNGSTEQGEFVTLPTTVPSRLGPNGDQCHLRLQATGPWRVIVCVEAGGIPKGLYRDEAGRLHYDAFDRCVETIVQV